MDAPFTNISNFDFKDKKYYSKNFEANQIITKLKTEDTVEHSAVNKLKAECRIFAIRVIENIRIITLTSRAIKFIKKASCLDPKKLSQPEF